MQIMLKYTRISQSQIAQTQWHYDISHIVVDRCYVLQRIEERMEPREKQQQKQRPRPLTARCAFESRPDGRNARAIHAVTQ